MCDYSLFVHVVVVVIVVVVIVAGHFQAQKNVAHSLGHGGDDGQTGVLR